MGGEALGVARRIARQIDRECVSEARLGVERLKHRTLRQIDSSNAGHGCSAQPEWKQRGGRANSTSPYEWGGELFFGIIEADDVHRDSLGRTHPAGLHDRLRRDRQRPSAR